MDEFEANIKALGKAGVEVSMRKEVILIMSLFFTFSMAACGSDRNGTSLTQENVMEKTDGGFAFDGNGTENGSKILISYFTVPETDGVDTVAGASRVAKDGEVLGNTEFIAKEIQKNIGGDLFAVKTVQEYPGEHQDLLDFAYDELEEDARPEQWQLEACEFTMVRFAKLYGFTYKGMITNLQEAQKAAV